MRLNGQVSSYHLFLELRLLFKVLLVPGFAKPPQLIELLLHLMGLIRARFVLGKVRWGRRGKGVVLRRWCRLDLFNFVFQGALCIGQPFFQPRFGLLCARCHTPCSRHVLRSVCCVVRHQEGIVKRMHVCCVVCHEWAIVKRMHVCCDSVSLAPTLSRCFCVELSCSYTIEFSYQA